MKLTDAVHRPGPSTLQQLTALHTDSPRVWEPLTRDYKLGAQSEADASIFRRRFVPELLMALHNSPLVDGSAARALALRVLCCAAAVPSLARQLASHSGEGRSRVTMTARVSAGVWVKSDVRGGKHLRDARPLRTDRHPCAMFCLTRLTQRLTGVRC